VFPFLLYNTYDVAQHILLLIRLFPDTGKTLVVFPKLKSITSIHN